MSRRPIIANFARWLLPGLGLLALACSNEVEGTAAKDVEGATVSVSIAPAEVIGGAAYLAAPGVVRPYRRAQLGTRQAGTVEAVLVRAGDHVVAGQEILQIDSRELEASRMAAILQRDSAREAHEQALRNRDRFRRLYDQGLVAKVRLEEAELQAERATSALGRAEAELAAIEVSMDYARLRAPFDGVVSEILTETGSFVMPGMPLVVFEDRGRLEVEAAIDQAKAAGLSVGARLPVVAEGISEPAEGRLQAVLPALAGNGAGLRLRALVDTPPSGLVPGMVVELRVPSTGAASHSVRVPAGAVVRRGQLTGVFVIEPGDQIPWRARLRWVSLDPSSPDDGWAYVQRGLEAGERVAYGSAISKLTDGQAVTLQD
ncbi:efflux RND transporter periplasmic adaptor subunit [Thioalkalivibrio sp. XN8]|uniref:efflux RND transporter periplasmic adaptor subunit n=1 Tax=Thioalkalivibrio sp. XN8 TaxID=2712863 RepID=UPI0013EE3BE3|nr:efflux RND transporter periplasmic adaptor subunit [Thioalkalivibrio sp. XN8]NGP54719.1 efflux RND transporter periplasmic adaptor subunit [Thioalkalivibrio sp. XN8]